LDGKDSHRDCDPAFDADMAESFFQVVYSSDGKEVSTPSWLPAAPAPESPFNESPFSPEELDGVLK
jgi:hypothetical protein